MAVAPLAPATVSLSMFALGIGAACVFVLLLGLRWAWRYTLGALMEALADVRIRIPGLPDPHPLRWLRRYNVAVQNDIEKKLERSHQAMGLFFHGSALLLQWMASEISANAAATERFAENLTHVRMPRFTKAMLLAAFPLAWLAVRVAAIVRPHLHRGTRTVVVRVERTVVHRVTRIVAATTGAVAIPLPHIRVFPRLRDLGQQIGRTRKQVRRLAYFTTATGAAVLVAKAFTRMGLNWLRCRNVSKVGRGICRMDLGVLNFLLGTATAVFALSHLCELVGYIQRATALALPSILALVNETEGYVCGGSKSLPSGIVATDGKRVAAFPTGVTHP